MISPDFLSEDGIFPLHPSQAELYYDQLIDPQSPHYNLGGYIKIKGTLDIDVFTSVLNVLPSKFDALRVGVVTDADSDVPFLKLRRQATQPFVDTLTFCDHLNPAQEAAAFLQSRFNISFDVFTEPLWEHRLINISPTENWYYFKCHHLIMDAFGAIKLINYIAADYNERVGLQQQPPVYAYPQFLPETLTATDYYDTAKFEKTAEYWKQKFVSQKQPLLQPKNYSHKLTSKGKRVIYDLSHRTSHFIKNLAKQYHVSHQQVLMAALMGYFNKIANHKDFVFGIPLHNRENIRQANIVGMFAKVTPFVYDLSPEVTVRELLNDIRIKQLEDYKYHKYPASHLRNELKGLGYTVEKKYFHILINHLNFNIGEVFNGLRCDMVDLASETQAIPLQFCWQDYGVDAPLKLRVDFLFQYFDLAEVDRMINRLNFIFEQFELNIDQPIARISVIPPAEMQSLIYQFNDTYTKIPQGSTLLDLISEQTCNYPDKVACIFNGEKMAYSQLNKKADSLARLLKHKGVGENSIVAICAERSINILIAMLGILKAGGAFLPVDPDFPPERIEYMLTDAAVSIILSSSPVSDNLTGYNAQVLDLDNSVCIGDMQPNDALLAKIKPESLAYVIYTSGSTGKPKGVMVKHENLLNFHVGMRNALPLNDKDHILAITSISFDISILELLYALSKGITITIAPKSNELANFNRFVQSKPIEMQFGLFYFSSYSYQHTANKYDFLLKSVKFADSNEFSSVWFPERHFHEFGGLYPDPAILAAALSNVTDNIKLHAGSIVLPLNDTIRIAEKWSVIDNLSGGRVGLSVTAGWHADDFALMPDNFLDRSAIMYKQIDELKSLWRGQSISRINGHGKNVEINVFPRPLQTELPLWITAAGNPDTFRYAGKIGAHLLTHLLGQDLTDLQKNLAIYKQELKNHGHDSNGAKITVMLHTYIGKELAQVKADVEEPFKAYLRSSANLMQNMAESLNIPASDFSEDTIAQLSHVAFERYWQNSALLGTKESCHALIEKLNALDVTEIGCLIDFGIDEEKVISSLDHLNELRKQYCKHNENAGKEVKPISALQITPSYLSSLLDDEQSDRFFKNLKTLIVGGEKLPVNLISKVKAATDAALFNVYGPTETTIWSTALQVTDINSSIGRPISNTRVYIFDVSGGLSPVGVWGELYIGGSGVSLGYLNQPELTRERFIADPYSLEGGRLYRTGDLCRWNEQGELEYQGRNDDQLKIRGYRIEPGEIVQALLESGQVSQAVVIGREDASGQQRLLGYMVVTPDYQASFVEAYLSGHLPGYMIPWRLIVLDSLPLTANGKVDKKALPDPDMLAGGQQDYTGPANPAEEVLVSIWQELLGVSRVGVEDNFFELGGDSIITIQVVSRARRQGYELRVGDLFEHQTIRSLSKLLETSDRQAAAGTVVEPTSGVVGLLPVQRWYLEGSPVQVSHFNQSVLLGIAKEVTLPQLEEALQVLLLRHDVFRYRYRVSEQGSWEQYYAGAPLPVKVNPADLEDKLSGTAFEAGINEVCTAAQQRLDIVSGALVGVTHIKSPPGEKANRLLLVIHHLVVDGVSWRILLEELELLLSGVISGQPADPGTPSSSYRHWYETLSAWGQGAALGQLSYWQGVAGRYAALPADITPSQGEEQRTPMRLMDRQVAVLPVESTRQLLQEVPRAYHTEINDILLAALAMTLTRWSGRNSVVIGLEGHGRQAVGSSPDISRTVGWFTSMYPVVLEQPPGGERASDWIRGTKEQLRSIPDKGLGYGVLRYLNGEQGLGRGMSGQGNPWDLLFNYLGQLDNTAAGSRWFSGVSESSGDDIDLKPVYRWDGSIARDNQINETITLNILVQGSEMHFHWMYSTTHYHADTVTALSQTYVKNLQWLINDCIQHQQMTPLYTPGDFGLTEDISYQELDAFFVKRSSSSSDNIMEF